MSIGQHARAIADSPTVRLNEQAHVLRKRGEPVIDFGIGEPKNKTPSTASEAAAAFLARGDIKYTPASGTPSLKKAIIRYTFENYGREVGAQNVIVSDGAKQAIFNALYTIVDPGQEVILLSPYWVSYPEMVKMCGGVPVVVDPPEGSFEPLAADIARSVTAKTRAIIVNSPNNPSGAVFSADLIAELVALCEQRGIYLIMDDIYHKLVFDGVQAPSCYRFTTRDVDSSCLIVVNGVAKMYGMTGFRVGWAVGPKDVVKVMSTVQSQTTTCTSALTQAAAEGALNGSQAVVEEIRTLIQRNRDAVLERLAAIPGVKLIKPRGTFYCLFDVRSLLDGRIASNSHELAEFLLNRVLVVVVPGKDFGAEGHLRLTYAGATDDVIEGLRRIRWALDPATPREISFGGKTYVRDWF